MAEFKSNTRYHIAPDSIIEMTGEEFVNIQNTLTRILQSPIYQEHLAIANTVASVGVLHDIIGKKLVNLVETDKATEVIPEGSNHDEHQMD